MTYVEKKCVVVKFGGTSVETVDRIKGAARIIADLRHQNFRVVAVVSAMSGETNRLVNLSQHFSISNPKAYDTIVSSGEQVTTGLLALALQELGIPSTAFQGWQLPILTSENFSKARIDHISTEKLEALLNADGVPVVPGFQGVTPQGDITTLGRGGSDVTAVVLAAALKADACYLYKDVPGILSADPRQVEAPRILDRLGIEEMFEMSSQGAKVVHPRAIEAAFVHDVPLKIFPTFDQGKGTTVTRHPLEAQTVTGIVCNHSEVRFVLQNMPLSPGVTAHLFDALAKADISLDMILQGGAVASDSTSQTLTFTVPESDADQTLGIIEKLKTQLAYSHVDVHPRIAKVSIVGAGLRGHASVANTLYETLSELGIALYGMTTTELKMSVLVSADYAQALVQRLHDNFNISPVAKDGTYDDTKPIFA